MKHAVCCISDSNTMMWQSQLLPLPPCHQVHFLEWQSYGQHREPPFQCCWKQLPQRRPQRHL
eukprot:6488504-Amphidinium_carterae.1